MQAMKKGTLFITATPIGNLEDMTLRAIRVLKEVDLVAAEDTRRTGMLLKHFGIERPLTSLHDHNEREKSSLIINRLLQGSDVAYVSDAGTPGISDPGYLLVRSAAEEGLPVVAIPGPSAVIAALSVSGLPVESFTFYGFPPARPARRRRFLLSISDESKTMVFFESPRRLASTLRDMLDIFGNRPMTLSREITKLHEETRRGPIARILEEVTEAPPKGEITLILAGKEEEPLQCNPEEIRFRYDELTAAEAVSTRDAAARIALETGLSKKAVYGMILDYIKQ